MPSDEGAISDGLRERFTAADQDVAEAARTRGRKSQERSDYSASLSATDSETEGTETASGPCVVDGVLSRDVYCHGNGFAQIETWEPARWILPVDGLTKTRTDAWWLRHQGSGSLSADATGSCWANPFTFIATVWLQPDCIKTKPPSSGFYTSFDATTIGEYFNYNFGVDAHQVKVVESASVQFVNGTPNWGVTEDHYDLGPWNIYETSFLSTYVNGMAWESGCEGSCLDPQETIDLCEHGHDFATWDWDQCACLPGASPIILDLDGDGLALTSWQDGVNFDLMTEGIARRVGWTKAGSRDPFLVLDRNQNRLIDDGGELFGNFTDQPDPRRRRENRNGFLALAVYDTRVEGGNADGLISDRDRIYSELQLWFDLDHNGRSTLNELFTLMELGVKELGLDYKVGKRQDEFGNSLRYRASFKLLENGSESKRRRLSRRLAYDVYFAYQK